MNETPSNFERLVLGCIDSNDSNRVPSIEYRVVIRKRFRLEKIKTPSAPTQCFGSRMKIQNEKRKRREESEYRRGNPRSSSPNLPSQTGTGLIDH